ncbi:hypothetical protein B0J12DRAFT_580359 [Macrophomina phaseolina]|uniref:Short-chain dehydrogenase/reductase SDR n=1 Tax=Macrophomina phaseolina TaxID=35725 RepID=A0ABQ8G0M6_9PEZI|nr:hypothetical protein B0J12DRAFT_580359 [Macrophomina phaseolina]
MTVKEGSLAGKFALVSGSSLGLGAAIARELFRRGASVAINYPYPSEEANAVKVLAPNQLSVAFEADLSTEDGPCVLADAAGQTFGQTDILVNCVGINRPMSLDDPDEEKVQATWNSIINLNARGTFFLTRAAPTETQRGRTVVATTTPNASRKHCQSMSHAADNLM